MGVVRAGLLFVTLIAVAVFFGFTKVNPFSNHFELVADFQDAKNLKKGTSEVRIAGVEVGSIKSVEPLAADSSGAKVTMEIYKSGLPIHDDAELKIRPQLFLEGNYFVDLQPGSPSAPEVKDGGTIPMTQTAIPVQFGDVLTALQADTRKDLRTLLAEYGFKGLNYGGASGFNGSIKYWEPAYRSASLVNDAMLGTRPGDLHRVVGGQQATLAALSDNRAALQGLITNFNTTANSFARVNGSLQDTLPALRRVLTVGPPALRSLQSSLPGVRRFARDALPGVRSSGPTLDALIPFVHQLRALVQPSELRGLVADLRPTVPALARLNQRTVPILDETRQMSACTNNVLIPFAESPVPNPDEPGNDKQLVMRQLPRSLVGLAGESRIADADSPQFRVNFTGGNTGLFLNGTSQGPAFAATNAGARGTRPARPSTRWDFRPDIPCETQDPPNLEAPLSRPGQATGPQVAPNLTQPKLDPNQIAALGRFLPDNVRGGRKGFETRLTERLKKAGLRLDQAGKVVPLASGPRKPAQKPAPTSTPPAADKGANR